MKSDYRRRAAVLLASLILLAGTLTYVADRSAASVAAAQTPNARARQARQRRSRARSAARRRARTRTGAANRNANTPPPTPTPSPSPTLSPTPEPSPTPIKIEPNKINIDAAFNAPSAWVPITLAFIGMLILLALSWRWRKSNNLRLFGFFAILITSALLVGSMLLMSRAVSAELQKQIDTATADETAATAARAKQQKEDNLRAAIEGLRQALPDDKKASLAVLESMLRELSTAPTPTPTPSATPSASPDPSPIVTLNSTSGFEISRDSLKFTNLPSWMILVIFLVSAVIAGVVFFFRKSPAAESEGGAVAQTRGAVILAVVVFVILLALMFGVALYLLNEVNSDLETKAVTIQNQLNGEWRAERVGELTRSQSRTPAEKLSRLGEVLQSALADKKTSDEALALLDTLKQSLPSEGSNTNQPPTPTPSPAAPAPGSSPAPTPCPTPCFISLPTSQGASSTPQANDSGAAAGTSTLTIMIVILGFLLLLGLEIILWRTLQASSARRRKKSDY